MSNIANHIVSTRGIICGIVLPTKSADYIMFRILIGRLDSIPEPNGTS